MTDNIDPKSNSQFSTISHHQGLLWLDEIRNEIRKDVLVKNYLYSLSTRDLQYRSGLASYAIARNMPLHDFTSERDGWCVICGEYTFVETKRDFSGLKLTFETGAIPWCDTSPVT
ncbi:MAG: hypothetical protein IPP15_12230 [Saprospiraceae bacterium]|uniref:Uncharacterized protein n=1 Tax=Candidatus Opimibacter skivensis TaxID=2982028 RepID=A0A9D7SU70_9BACT|nr:hypothetical protein [Candidatus Opimibacter skivensis]